MSDEEIRNFLHRVAWFGRTDAPPLVSSPMYERFTDRARKVMHLAQQECDRLNHEYVGTEHILLGLLKEGTDSCSGVAGNVLRNMGLNFAKCRDEIAAIVMPGEPDDDSEKNQMKALVRKPLTPRAKQVIEFAIEEAKKLDHNYIGTEHLLLGSLHVTEGIACQVLRNFEIKVEDVREAILNLLGTPAEKGATKEMTWKVQVPATDTDRHKLAEIERIVRFEKDPAKAVEAIKKLFGE